LSGDSNTFTNGNLTLCDTASCTLTGEWVDESSPEFAQFDMNTSTLMTEKEKEELVNDIFGLTV
jgi:hypothetical protein